MSGMLRIALGQLGGIAPEETRDSAVARMLALMQSAKREGATLIVFPELALTTFFPRYVLDGGALDGWFESAVPGPATQPLFDFAREHRIGFVLGYAERDPEGRHFNTAILVDDRGMVAGKYRKIHLPGDAEPQPGLRHQHLEKRYFEIGDLGFPVFDAFGTRIGLAICNDRRWPETYRVMALKGAELVFIGYNTPVDPDLYPGDEDLSLFQHHLSLQSGAHHNAIWVAATAKAGWEGDARLLGGTAVVSPTGEIVAQASTTADELVIADCDLAVAQPYRDDLFNFSRHRQIEEYRLIAEQRGRSLPES